MAKKENKKIKKSNISNQDEFGKLIKLIIIVTVIFLVFYGITFLVNRKEEVEDDTTKAEIQYDNILIGDLLKQSNDEYYVMIYDNDDYNKVVYQTYLSKYKSKEDAIRYYTADLDNPFNSSFVGEKENLNIKDIKDLKLVTSTLIKVKSGKIEKYYTGDKIKEHLQEITKEEEE